MIHNQLKSCNDCEINFGTYLKAFSTKSTGKRFQSSVCTAMCDQIWCLTKCFATHDTFMRFLPWNKWWKCLTIEIYNPILLNLCSIYLKQRHFRNFFMKYFFRISQHCQIRPKTQVLGSLSIDLLMCRSWSFEYYVIFVTFLFNSSKPVRNWEKERFVGQSFLVWPISNFT